MKIIIDTDGASAKCEIERNGKSFNLLDFKIKSPEDIEILILIQSAMLRINKIIEDNVKNFHL